MARSGNYRVVTLEGVGDAVAEMVAEHIQETREELDKRVKKAGQTGAKALRNHTHFSPDGHPTGTYAAGWRSQFTGTVDCPESRVYNAAEPHLTHLLEFGHGLVYFGRPTGKRVQPYPHMEEGFDAGKKELGV